MPSSLACGSAVFRIVCPSESCRSASWRISQIYLRSRSAVCKCARCLCPPSLQTRTLRMCRLLTKLHLVYAHPSYWIICSMLHVLTVSINIVCGSSLLVGLYIADQPSWRIRITCGYAQSADPHCWRIRINVTVSRTSLIRRIINVLKSPTLNCWFVLFM